MENRFSIKNIFLGFVLISSGGIFSQNGAFADFKFTSSNKATNGTMKVSFSEYGHKIEMSMFNPQMPAGGITTITLSNKKNPDVYYTLNEKTKTYSELPAQDTRQTPSDSNEEYKVKKSGEETVNGYKCIHFTVTSEKETSEVWTTKAIPEYLKYKEAARLNKRGYSFKRDKAIEEAGCDGFPVKTIRKAGHLSDKEEDVIMELIKFEKKSFSEGDFSIPDGYKKSEGITPGMGPQINSQDLMKMTPEERAKYIEEMKKKYGK